MNRRTFMGVAGSALLAATQKTSAMPNERMSESAQPDGLKVRFLGTGAADWRGPDERGEHRRLSSILLDGHILIDYTRTVRDMIPEGCRPTAIFYTHSHSDHYNAEAAIELGIQTVYLSQTWFDIARTEFAEASRKLSLPAPRIMPVCVGQAITVDDITFHPLPANHATSHLLEQTLIYLVEKGPTRMLYATDTSGLTAVAARLAGIDAHQKGTPITALVMEATMGMEHEVDFRLFAHSSVATVERTVKVLTETKRYQPRTSGQTVYITHLARTLHGTQAELDAQLPSPLRAAYDGLEVVF